MKQTCFIFVLLSLLTFIGCSRDNAALQQQREDGERMVYEAYMDKDYKRILSLSDSLRKAGLFSEGKAAYWMGYASDRLMQKRMAELYWKTGLATVSNSTEDEDIRVYAGIANRLTGLKTLWGEYEAALKVAQTAVERLEKLGYVTSSEYANLLIYQGCCQQRFDISEKETNQTLERGYQSHLNLIKRNPHATSYRDAIVGVINISYNFLDIHDYVRALKWTDRLGRLIERYEQMPDARADYAEKQWARYNIYRATALAGLGRTDESDTAFQAYEKSSFEKTAEGKILSSVYLGVAGRWQEAADNFINLNTLMKEYNTDYSLENIQKMLLKKYEANRNAGWTDTASAVSIDITEHLDSAITLSRMADAREQEVVHQKELEMAAEREAHMRSRQMGRMILMAAFIVLLIIYIVVRHRIQARLQKAHNLLQEAYDKLEETTTAKERMESELRIARNIQMSMVPSVFPEIDGLDMYASMTPAKEVGGDLYSYLILGDKLYFCIGDVSGKGVPASLVMATATRGFRTMALMGRAPAEIASHLNAELTENNDEGMFVTMFICRLDLKSHKLEYCNAGHNPPLIGSDNGQFTYLEVLPNAPVGLWPEMEYEGEVIECLSNQLLLLYTDGLNEAENQQQDQYGEERMVAFLSANASASGQQIIERLQADVERFRGGAEPNDDITMLCLSIKG